MLTLQEISEALAFPLRGDGTILISGPAEPRFSSNTNLALAMDSKYFNDLRSSDAKAAIVMDTVDWKSLGLEGALLVSRARYALSGINSLFEEPLELKTGIHPTAVVADTAKIGKNVKVGAYSTIGSNCSIGENTIIANQVSIGADAVIGSSSLIHDGVRVCSRVQIGDRFICQSNSVIGSDGFSYVSPEGGGVEDIRKYGSQDEVAKIKKYVRIASLGSVVISNDVEIGAGTTIDRGTISNTKIGEGSKIDNMVHIGHNVVVGNHCLLCGQVGIAGSTIIGDRVVLGGQVGVADHLSIGDDTIIAGKSGVSSNVPKGQFMMGNPAMKMENSVSSYKAYRRLPRLFKKIEKIEAYLTKSDKFIP
jgi:UDP-3-O-[3-hydroxymyristoyl] glucosamine N-acyltransferase